MRNSQPARLLRIHIAESDRWQGKPLHEALVARCRALGIAGATVFRGLEGYGETAGLHTTHLLRRDQPVVVVVADEAAKIESLIREAADMIDTGMMAVSDVRVVRVQKDAPVSGHD
jgi:PII-like signaling protein